MEYPVQIVQIKIQRQKITNLETKHMNRIDLKNKKSVAVETTRWPLCKHTQSKTCTFPWVAEEAG